MLRKEQGMAAQERGDLQAAEALFADAETLARQSPVPTSSLRMYLTTRLTCTRSRDGSATLRTCYSRSGDRPAARQQGRRVERLEQAWRDLWGPR